MRVVVLVAPWLSVTVSEIVLVPLVVYVCVVDTPVAVPPSPKSQAYDATVPGAVSVEPEASTVQVAVGQLAVNDATGATFGLAVWSGWRTTVHMVALPDAKLAVAVRPGRGTRSAPLRSGRRRVTVIRPVPDAEREGCAGSGRPEASSPSCRRTCRSSRTRRTSPRPATFAPGVVCVVRLVVSPADAKAAMGLSVAVPS